MADGKKIASEFMTLVSSMNNDAEEQAFVDEILNSHRTLQQSAAGVLLKLFAGWAALNDTGSYDMRNEATVKVAKRITDATEDHYLPYV